MFAINQCMTSEEVKRIRKKLNLTQKELALLTNSSKSTIERWEGQHGKTSGAVVAFLDMLDKYPEYLEEIRIPNKEYPLRLKYMYKLFTIDALFLNEDRHMHNVAVLMNGKGEFEYCPIFDNGAGLLADTTMDYPMSGNVGDMIGGVKARTISTEFDEQLDASEQLYGCNIKFYFNRDDLAVIVNKATIYAQEERKRVEEIITLQMRKYQYLFE